MRSVRVYDPCDIWAEGVASILRAAGFVVEVSIPGPHSVAIGYALDRLMLIARPLLSAEIMAPGARSPGQPRPMVVAVLHARDELSLSEFADSALAGVLLSSSSREAVLDCVRSVLGRRRWIDPHSQLAFEPPRPRDWCRLSLREIEVASLAAQGLSNKRIAKALNLSDGTVKIHIHHILGKLGVESRTELAREIKI